MFIVKVAFLINITSRWHVYKTCLNVFMPSLHGALFLSVTTGVPGRVLYGWHKIRHKTPSSVEPHAPPEGQGLESRLGLVLPGALRGIVTPGRAPGWTVGTHILHIPWVWDMALWHARHGLVDLAGVFLYPHLAESGVTHKLRVSICDESCDGYKTIKYI